jgi:hypothetical protein
VLPLLLLPLLMQVLQELPLVLQLLSPAAAGVAVLHLGRDLVQLLLLAAGALSCCWDASADSLVRD